MHQMFRKIRLLGLGLRPFKLIILWKPVPKTYHNQDKSYRKPILRTLALNGLYELSHDVKEAMRFMHMKKYVVNQSYVPLP